MRSLSVPFMSVLAPRSAGVVSGDPPGWPCHALRGLVSGVLLLTATVASGQIVIHEIHYEPEVKTSREEFVELFNAGQAAINLSDWFFSDGIEYRLPADTMLASGGFLVVAQDPDAMMASYGVSAVGPFEGRLDNQGELVRLRDATGAIQDQVDYGVGFPWPVASAGRRSSMELIHPSLDNDLGGSWRASGVSDDPPPARVFLFEEGSLWRYRKATSEPPSAWRETGFVEDDTWFAGQTPIGFGPTVEPVTEIDDMRSLYSGLYLRRSFQISGELPAALKLRALLDDGAVVWINGVEVLRQNVDSEAELTFESVARRATVRPSEITETLPAPSLYLREGENTIAVHALNVRVTSNDFVVDFALFVPGAEDGEVLAFPSPGVSNSVFSDAAPPQVRQVRHTPATPRSDEELLVTAKVTDPDGVARVELLSQIVAPGAFVPAFLALPTNQLNAQAIRLPNPEFENPANWTVTTLRDDGQGGDATAGDTVYSTMLPALPHRTLLRYRVRAIDGGGASVQTPLRDDGTLNFAAFVYDGVPPYVASERSVHPDGPGHVYPAELLTSLPVYHLLTRAEDMWQCLAYEARFQIPKSNEVGRDTFNWEGAFVYQGRVYDHVRYRLRQANDRYGGAGKRSMRIRFHEGHYLQAHDQVGRPYPTRWRTLNIGKGFDNKRVGNFGLTETANAILWNMVGVPAPYFHTFHFRVIDDVDEVPAVSGQYFGDFWGMFVATENYDPRFLEAHDLPDGNLYKLKDGQFNGNDFKRNQGLDAVATDEDFQNIRRALRPERDAAWLEEHVNYDRWYAYHAVVEGIRHYDFVPADSHSKNRAWFFEPSDNPLGRLWTLPHDSDASWGPNWNSGVDYSKNAIFADEAKGAFRREYRNMLREFRDLVWNREVLESLIDGVAAPVLKFSQADRDRWREATPEAGRQDFGPIEDKIADMKGFAFTGWVGSTGPEVPVGGRALHLDTLAQAEGDGARLPTRPTVFAVTDSGPLDTLGLEALPLDALTFEASPFEDSTGEGFAAIRWRLGDSTSGEPGDVAVRSPSRYECPAVWELERTEGARGVHIPRTAVGVGRTYRVRVKYRNALGIWSHWSEPVDFTAAVPGAPSGVVTGLRVTELMYHPGRDSGFEFIEVQNTGSEALDLQGVELRGGIEFSLLVSAEPLLPGAYAVVVKNRATFEAAYGRQLETGSIRVLGDYRGQLSNGGESIEVVHGAEVVLAFEYDDSWYPSTDGAGRSLVLRDTNVPVAELGLAVSWEPSSEPGGSPGRADTSSPAGGQLPGDVTQDGQLDLADAVATVELIFGGRVQELPCGDGTLTTAANRQLADFSGDGRINLVDAVRLLDYLYRQGPGPALGTQCLEVTGCAEVCAPEH